MSVTSSEARSPTASSTGKSIQPIAGDLFGAREPDGDKVALDDVTLLYPCEPPKVLAVGLNYKSHLGDREPPRQSRNFL